MSLLYLSSLFRSKKVKCEGGRGDTVRGVADDVRGGCLWVNRSLLEACERSVGNTASVSHSNLRLKPTRRRNKDETVTLTHMSHVT